MKKKTVSGIMLTLLLISMSTMALNTMPVQGLIPPAGLVSWWPGDGDAKDFINGNHGTLVNGATFAPGKVGQAFSFDGVDDFAVAPGMDIDGLQKLTIDAWVKLNSMPSGKIERFVTLTGEKAVLRYDGENGPRQLHFYMKIDDMLHHIRVNDVLVTGVFHLVAGTYDGSFMRLSLDGTEVGNLAVSGTVGAGFGVELSSMHESLDGFLDEIEIYNRALSISEIQAIYNAGSAGKKKPVASIDICPGTLNLKSKGRWITAYVQLPEGYNPEDIDAATILLNDTIQPVLDPKYDFVTNSSEYLVDHDDDGVLERMVKFDKAEVMALLSADEATLRITGKVDGTPFAGSDTIRVIGEMFTLIGHWSGVEMDAFIPVLQAFEEETGIDVEYKIFSGWDLATLLPLMFAAETTPGDVIFMWSSFIQEKGQEGHILDVTDLINEADFWPGALDPVKVGDALYGGVYTSKVKPGFWYRKSFFEAHGLTPPTTWDEFVALLEVISAIPSIVNPIVSGDGVGWPLSDVTEHFLITFGGPQLHRDLTDGKTAWNSPTVRTIFADRLVPLLEARYFSEPIEWTTALNLWWEGNYGLYFMGSWVTLMVDDPEDLGVFCLPGTEGLVFSPDYSFIPVYTEHPKEAKELFKFLASEEAQSIQVAQGGHIATNIHVPLDAYPPVDRQVAEVVQGKEILTDLDDAIGGVFQVTFWNQLKLLWVSPTSLDDVLDAIEAVAP